MRCEIIRDAQGFEALRDSWDELAAESGLFLSHAWLRAWWHAFHGVDELWVLTLAEGDQLLAGWPLHLRAPRGGPMRVAELRVLGDVVGARRSLVCRAGEEARAAGTFLDALHGERGWDVLDVPAVRKVAEAFERAAADRGIKADVGEVASRAYVDLPPATHWDEFARSRRPARSIGRWQAAGDVQRALDDLQRLQRKEWAAGEATSAQWTTAGDPAAAQFLAEAVTPLHARGLAVLGQVRADDGALAAADLVVRDGERAVELLRGVDPDHASASLELRLGAMQAATEASARRFELSPSEPADVDEATLKAAPGKQLRVRLWNATAFGRLHRSVASLKDVVSSATSTGALEALDKLRERAPEAVQRAVARVATYATLHLYRGELFVRDLRASDLSLRLLPRNQFDALAEAERDEFVQRLDLQPGYCRQKWDRGDMVVLAEVGGRPAGILWCARTPVYVPDIGREVRPGGAECYIHDVYVHPDERGRKVAPAMLDFLARELRSRDVYRAWALIERSNTASTRAFEKAAYASVADVVYARMGIVSRLIVRPPDPEARAFLGL